VGRATPRGRISWARTAHRTPYGLAEVAWERGEDELRVHVTVPTGSITTVVLPGVEPSEIAGGTHRFVVPHPGPLDDRELSAGVGCGRRRIEAESRQYPGKHHGRAIIVSS
jgi:hypothetical protein